MTEEINKVIQETKANMEKAIEHLSTELANIRAGKASPSMVAGVSADYYGTKTPLSQLANISAPDARSLTIQPWDKSALAEIEKAIFASNLGLTPQSDGELIRLNIPPLTEERRKELAKQIKGEGEKAKISLRTYRKTGNDAIKQLGKNGLSEDLVKDTEEKIQNITKDFGGKVDKLISAKETEVMSV